MMYFYLCLEWQLMIFWRSAFFLPAELRTEGQFWPLHGGHVTTISEVQATSGYFEDQRREEQGAQCSDYPVV